MSRIDIKVTVPDMAGVFKKHQRDYMMVLAATMQTNRAMMFDKDGADNGKPAWAPLVLRKGRPLQKRGTLRQSMAPHNDGIVPGRGMDTVLRFAGVSVTMGTALSYARMMNDGTTKMPNGKLVPTRAKALKIPLEDGSFMFRRSVKIPARAMDQITEEDKKEFSMTLANFIADLLNKGE